MKKLSIVIPTYNEQDVIAECLRSLSDQTYKEFEVIIVDDGSTDSTVSIINDFSQNKNSYAISLQKGKHKGAGAARNLGAKEANGDILVFVDADMTFDKKFLSHLVQPILDGKSRGTFPEEEIVSNWDNVWSRCYNLNEGWENKKRHPKYYPKTQQVFRAILKTEFDKVGGFTPGGYNDDWSLSEKLGYLANVSPQATFYHKNPSSLSEVFKHAKWVGKRPYKFGIFGYLIGLFRSSLPVSLVVGIFKSFIYSVPQFVVFKIVSDTGIFLGILDYMFTKRGAK